MVSPHRLVTLVLLGLAACVGAVDLTPSPGGAAKPKPDGPAAVTACDLDGGTCPQLSPSCARDKYACTVAADCCSGRCEIKTTAAGVCKLLPSCHVSYEACAVGTDCCSGVCIMSEEGGGRCEPATGCASVGERCATSTLCCSGTCRASPEGVLRCAAAKCKALGETCTGSDQCCDKDPASCREGGGAGLRCLGAPGTLATCLVDGVACAVPEQCCGGGCWAGATGLLTCGSAEGPPVTTIP
jgi:hypothetical protein